MLCSCCRKFLKLLGIVATLALIFCAAQFLEKITVDYTTSAKDLIQLAITVIFGLVTASFSYYAYNFSKEKFRLDLLERRWTIYEEVLKFCSAVSVEGGIPPHSDRPEDQARNERVIEGLNAANNSFRSLGYHKTKALFGKDIEDYFEKINASFSWLVSFNRVTEAEQPGVSAQWSEHVCFISKTVEELPDLFKPYVYFGDFKKKV